MKGKNKKASKKRLDETLVERGIAGDIKIAQSIIISGKIYSDNKPLNKPGMLIRSDAEIEVKDKKESRWVSRGGMKLEHAIKLFKLNLKDKICVDVGASTGGFTDVLLFNGAKKVYAVDVGYGQLAWKLQQDERVIVLDKTNARYLSEKEINEKPDGIVCDASFISLKTILPASMKLANKGCALIALIKPQFEAKRDEVGHGGIVRDDNVHKRVCNEINEWFAMQEGWNVEGLTESPIKGGDGNKEFLIYAVKE